MGQRLNIEIIQNGETLANAYYHWSAYTSSSLELTKVILENMEQIQHQDPMIRAVRLLEKTGAHLTPDEIEKMKQRNPEEPFETAVSRNDGLIAISEEGMDTTRKWEEGRVEINLDEETVNFYVWCQLDKDAYLYDYERTEEDYQQLPIKSFDCGAIPFLKFEEIAAEVLQEINNGFYEVRLENGEVLSFTE